MQQETHKPCNQRDDVVNHELKFQKAGKLWLLVRFRTLAVQTETDG